MLRLLGDAAPLCDRISRRDLMRVGAIGLGSLSLPQLFQARAQASNNRKAKAKSVIVLFNGGGIPHHETWDPKPDAPAEIRGAHGVIPTRTPGYYVGALMPRTAELTEKIAVIRTMVTGDNAHSTSGYQMLTGVPHIPKNKENSTPGRPNDVPPYNAIVRQLRAGVHGMPSSVVLPRRLANFNGLYPWPGTDAGVLGRSSEAWALDCDPSSPNFTAPGCEIPKDLSAERIEHRKGLLEHMDHALANQAATSDLERYRQQALDLLMGGAARKAFDLNQEPVNVRERYGRTKHGQSVLLARRLVEAGVSLVQVNWASQDPKLPNGGGWDTHEKHSESLKGWLMPAMDQTYSALIEDLDQRGLLEETLVCWVAEFGHTPRFNARAGRDHWGNCFSIALAGGGIRGGIVLGKSDKQAASPVDQAYRPADYLATIYHCLGFDPDTMVQDIEGRPLPINHGRVITPLVS